MTDGLRRHRIKLPDLGHCPHCNCIATARHMFDKCPLARATWTEMDNIGRVHFCRYKNFDYNSITDLYLPQAQKVFQVMGLWAIWCQWLDVWSAVIEAREVGGIDDVVGLTQGLIASWVDDTMIRFKQELILRLAEAPAVQ